VNSVVHLCRLLALEGFSSSLMMMFIHHVLSVPASILHLHSSSPEVIHQLHKVDFLSRLMEVLSNMKISHAGLESNAVISITCNVFYLASLEGNVSCTVGKDTTIAVHRV
jgi:hypothetical protein